MAKSFSREARERYLNKVVFKPVEREFGEGEDKHVLTLRYDDGTGRFDLRVDDSLVVSSMVLGDCVSRAKEKGIVLSPEETAITFKVDSPR